MMCGTLSVLLLLFSNVALSRKLPQKDSACHQDRVPSSSSYFERAVDESDLVVKAEMVAKHSCGRDGSGTFVGEFLVGEVYKGGEGLAEALGVSQHDLSGR